MDIFHLPNNFPNGRWRDEYNHHKKVDVLVDVVLSLFCHISHLHITCYIFYIQVVARILFIDPSTRAVGLTLNTELILNKLPSTVSFVTLFIKFLSVVIFCKCKMFYLD